jgi:membrane-associated protease RseP (regulator of RpoE activity)
MKINYSRVEPVFLAMTIVALILSAIGMWDVSKSPYSGYRLNAEYRVVRVDGGSPAAEAGIRVGDRMKKIEGVSTERLYQLSKLSRAEIGETQKLTLQRDGTELAATVTPTALPAGNWILVRIKNIMGLLMIAIGYAVFKRRPGKEVSLFFLFNLFVALAFITPPYFESVGLRRAVAVNFLVFLTLGLACFLHLTVIFPKSKPLVRETPLELFIYGPVPLMALAYSALRVFQPDADLLLNVVLHYAFGLMVLLCLGFAVAAVANSYWIAGDAERAPTQTMLIGCLLGTIPVAAGLLTDSFLPYTALPLSDYYTLPVILVTLSLGKALWQLKSTGEASGLRRVA